MPSEKAFWSLIRRNISNPPDTHLVRIENAVYSGTPDLGYCIKGCEGHLELKYLEEYPKRDTTIVRIPHFTVQQRTWLHDRSLAGGRCYVALSVYNKDIYLFDGLQAAMFLGKEWAKEDLTKKSVISWVGERVNWDNFVKRLSK